MDARQQKLADLIQLKGDVHALKRELDQFPWDSDVTLFTMHVQDVLHVLSLFSTHRIDARIVEEWANAIECRDGIAYANTAVHEAIILLANPVLYGELSPRQIEDIRKALV